MTAIFFDTKAKWWRRDSWVVLKAWGLGENRRKAARVSAALSNSTLDVWVTNWDSGSNVVRRLNTILTNAVTQKTFQHSRLIYIPWKVANTLCTCVKQTDGKDQITPDEDSRHYVFRGARKGKLEWTCRRQTRGGTMNFTKCCDFYGLFWPFFVQLFWSYLFSFLCKLSF